VAHTVIGVLPEGFSFPADAALWIPLAVRAEPGLSYTRPVIGRLRSGVAAEQARAAWEALATTLPVEGPPTGWLPQLIPLKDAIVGDVRTPLLIFSGAVGLVLLIVCANLSNLLLMRGLARRQEILTRLSLGAGRPRVVRQLLGEAAVMGVVGGAAAVLMTSLTVPALLAVVPAGRLPRAGEIQVDGSVLAFTFALAMMVALVVGLLPAVQATRGDVSASSRELAQWTTPGSSRLRHALVVAEVAVALVLLVGAGLLVRSFIRLRAVEPGFRPERVMTMTVDLPSSTYAQLPGLQAFHGQLLRSLSALPDVTSAGAVNWMPFGDVVISGDLLLPDGRGDQAIKAAVTPGYFRAMGVRLKRGRDFADADRTGAPGVVIVSERVARRLWGREDAIGRRLSIESRPAERDWLTVVGVVDDVRQGSLKEEPGPAIYQPYQQVTRPFFLTRMTFVVRTSGHPQRIAPAMRAALRDLDPHLAAHSIASMDDVVGRTIAEPRFQTHLLAVFSGLAVVLAAIGVYGVLAFSVTERRREIGIRVALGADAAVLVRMVLHRVLVLATYGIAAGIAGAFAFSHVLRGLLFEIGPTDAPTFLGAAVGLTAVALIAGWIPARRAAAVDPVTILRAE
jgi:predicted permease